MDKFTVIGIVAVVALAVLLVIRIILQKRKKNTTDNDEQLPLQEQKNKAAQSLVEPFDSLSSTLDLSQGGFEIVEDLTYMQTDTVIKI